jgi:hypothetical protein
MGSEFVEKVTEYLLSTGEEVQGVAVIPWYLQILVAFQIFTASCCKRYFTEYIFSLLYPSTIIQWKAV